MEKTLLQLQSGKEKFTTEHLQDNLETVLQGVIQSAHVLNTKHVNINRTERNEKRNCLPLLKRRKNSKRESNKMNI